MTKFIDLIDEHLQSLGLLELARAFPSEVSIPYKEILKIEKKHEALLNRKEGLV
jgi:hypothetical protein